MTPSAAQLRGLILVIVTIDSEINVVKKPKITPKRFFPEQNFIAPKNKTATTSELNSRISRTDK